MKGGIFMNKKKTWVIKGIPLLALVGIISLNLLIFPKVMVAAGNAGEGEVVEIAQEESESVSEEAKDGISQDQTEDVEEDEKGTSNNDNILDTEIYSVKIKGTEVKATQKEGGVVWVMVDPDTAMKVNGKEKINDRNLGILVVKPEKNR